MTGLCAYGLSRCSLGSLESRYLCIEQEANVMFQLSAVLAMSMSCAVQCIGQV